MNGDDRDPAELVQLDIVSRARLFEDGVADDWPSPFVGFLKRADGEIIQTSFESLASIAWFVRDMTPANGTHVFVGAGEDGRAMTQALSALVATAAVLH